ncbi:hypothetical protein BC628DRAFT_986785 [Trametes gibbosa]|nr:hypothetical protein BC628DRAFT_986785 [Trametes gibbosa]
MQFLTILAIAASMGLVVAIPRATEPVPAAHGGNNEAVLTTESGCGSTGPLKPGNFYIWYIIRSCTPGARMTCQATDRLGCVPGSTAHIKSMEVDDPNDTFNIARGDNTNTVPFICPEGGSARCQVDFKENTDGPNYSLRVFEDA